MPKVKIPRKSTTIDMTAMCDVAFLLLSFFILATKQKPPEVLTVAPPNSVSSKVAPEKAILVTLTKDGRTFLMLGDESIKGDVLKTVNDQKGLGLTSAELSKWKKSEFVGLPFNQIKSALALPNDLTADKMPGIPTDTSNNQMIDWMKAITTVFAQQKRNQKELQEMLLVKGDQNAFYPAFKNIKESFKKNEIFKFRIVTNGEGIPVGSELYNNAKK